MCGVVIPKGITVLVGLTFLQNNPEIWFEPEAFRPERFDPKSDLFKTPDGKNRHPLTWIPFSFGMRNCPGQILALLEMRVFIA